MSRLNLFSCLDLVWTVSAGTVAEGTGHPFICNREEPLWMFPVGHFPFNKWNYWHYQHNRWKYCSDVKHHRWVQHKLIPAIDSTVGTAFVLHEVPKWAPCKNKQSVSNPQYHHSNNYELLAHNIGMNCRSLTSKERNPNSSHNSCLLFVFLDIFFRYHLLVCRDKVVYPMFCRSCWQADAKQPLHDC